MCHAVAMRIGILGGTGPAGSGLAARLASIGYPTVIGSRSKYRAMETRDELVGKWPQLADLLEARRQRRRRGVRRRRDRHPVGLRRRHRTGEREGAGGQDRDLDGERTRAGEQGVPAAGAAARQRRRARPGRRSASAVWSRRSTTFRQPNSATSTSRSTPTCSSAATIHRQCRPSATSSPKFPGCRPLDAGELSNATAIEAFTAVLLQLNVRYKTRVAPKLTGIKRDPRVVDAG